METGPKYNYETKDNNRYEEKQERQDYGREFSRKPLRADTEEKYTEQMWKEDQKYLDEWIEYERVRNNWLKEELNKEKERRFEIAGSDIEKRKEALDWYSDNLKGLLNQWSAKMNEIFTEKKRINDIYFDKKFNKGTSKEEEKFQKEFEFLYRDLYQKIQYTNFVDIKDISYIKKARQFTLLLENLKKGNIGLTTWQAKLVMLKDFQGRIDSFLRETEEERKRQREKKGPGEPDKPGGPKGPEDPDEKKAEQIAIQELGITKTEFDMIVRNAKMLGENQLIQLTMKVVGAKDKSEIKRAYYKCVKEWHPDTGKTRYGIGVNEIKLKIANNLYGEYKDRFGNN